MNKVIIVDIEDIDPDLYCLISYQKFNKTDENNPIVKLICGHCYYYKNIKMSYTTSHKIQFQKRICPYCMQYGGYLPNINNEYVKDVHPIIREKCNAILVSGVNKGKKCKNNGNPLLIKNNKYYCVKHKHYLKK